jgi:hypothetical protein
MFGSAPPRTAIDCSEPSALIEKLEVWMPEIAFELRMNWRRLPWMERFGLPASSSPSLELVTALKLKPESTPVTSPPKEVRVTLVTCSASVRVVASSERRGSRPPKSAPFAARKPAPCAAPATPKVCSAQTSLRPPKR